MSQKFYNIIKPLEQESSYLDKNGNSLTWGDAIITIQCKDVYLKAESLIEEIERTEPEFPSKKNPLIFATGRSNILIDEGIYYLAQYGQYYEYSVTNNQVTLNKVSGLKPTTSYEKVAGSYKYDLLRLQQLIYGLKETNPSIGIKFVSQNYWKLEVTAELEDNEYFYFQRTWVALPDEYNIEKITQQYSGKELEEKIEIALKEDTTLMSAYTALKKAVALAEFYCTCIPKIDIHPDSSADDYNFLTFYIRDTIATPQTGRTIVNLQDGYKQLDLSDYTKAFMIDPQTHVLKLGVAEVNYDSSKKRPLPYFVIRDYYRNAGGVMIARPAQDSEGNDYPSDIHFQQLMQKVNSTYDFNLPVDPQSTNKESSVHKSYIYDKIEGRWVEVEALDSINYN